MSNTNFHSAELHAQRERILNAFLAVVPFIGTIVYLVAIPSTIQDKAWFTVAIYSMGWLGLSGIALLRKRLPYTVKTVSILALIYLIAVQSIPSYGFASGIQGWLLALTILSIIFWGNSGGYVASALGAATMGAGGAWVLLTRPILLSSGSTGTPLAWAISSAAYLIISIGVTVILSNLLNTLETNLAEKGRLAMELNQKNLSLQENAKLLQSYGRQFQKRASRLQAIAELSQTITLIQNPDELLPVVARLISERFGYYHTGIFLIDEDRRYAILRATNSEGGRKMLARGYKLRIGEAGIAGFVAQSGRPRLALDTSEDSAHFNNPNLPDTRSEVALPLRVGQVVIGVLDVQSTEPSAFDDEDLDILNTLANQVATVIQNARLFEQSRSALQGYSQAGHRLWREHIVKRTSGYAYRPDGTLASAPPESKQQLQNLIASGQTVVRNAAKAGTASTLAIPVKLRDQVIGVIHVESTDEKRIWSDDEIAIVQSISERAALALENARLFEEATHRAERERVMAQVTSHISESASFERILQTTLQELSHSLGATRTFIQLETPSSDEIETSPHQHAED